MSRTRSHTTGTTIRARAAARRSRREDARIRRDRCTCHLYGPDSCRVCSFLGK